jgi:hypothetical protein
MREACRGGSDRHQVRLVMRSVGLSLLTVGFTMVASPASAAVVALWHMDEPSGAATMVDSSGTGNNGSIPSTVTTGAPGLVSGNAYVFSGGTSFIQVPDNGSLDPLSSNMTITATVKTVGGAMPADSYDLVRKGLSSTPGGDWKMEIKRASNASVGKLNCVFKGVLPNGTKVSVGRVAGVNINDARPHTIKCIKTPTSVQAVVDGQIFTTSKTTGRIDNSAPVTIGAKSSKEDGLRGTLDEVSVEIG